MNKVAVFGKPGSGKSTLSRKLATATGILLYSLDSFWQRLEQADTLMYIDLPYRVSYWLVTKRLIKGLIVKPEGWPEGSSVFKGSLQS